MLKYALLALLAQQPRHGYDLKSAFEAAMGGTWPLNIGQIYTTLARLERDGLVACEVVEQHALPDRKVYSLTQLGRKDLARWLDEPPRLAPPLRDELFVKLVAHELAGAGDRHATLASARREIITAMGALGSRRDEEPPDSVTGLLLDAALGQLAALARWLDDVETR